MPRFDLKRLFDQLLNLMVKCCDKLVRPHRLPHSPPVVRIFKLAAEMRVGNPNKS
jgi:hypothetical protein